MFTRRARVPAVTVDELERALAAESPPLLVDVRGADEFARGRLPGAVNIPFAELEARAAELDPRRPTVFY